ALLAQGLTGHPLLAHPSHHPHPMVASLDGHGPTLRAPGADQRGHHRTRH
ncbi:IS701 family transposase, partial [Streptomyces sp. NPDC001233]